MSAENLINQLVESEEEDSFEPTHTPEYWKGQLEKAKANGSSEALIRRIERELELHKKAE